MTAAAWVSRVLGLLLTVSPSIFADEIEIVGRLQLQAQLDNAGDRSRVTGRLLDELGRPVHGTLVVRATDPALPIRLESCGSSTEDTGTTTQVTSSDQGDFCAWLKDEKDEVSVFASANHYQNTHITVHRDHGPLLPPRFLSAPTTLTRGSAHVNTVEIRVSAADPIPTLARDIELALRCGSLSYSLGKQPVASSRVIFEFTTPGSSVLGTCQLEAQLLGSAKAPAITRVDVLVQAKVTLRASHVKVSTETATVELSALAGKDIPTGVIEATRGSVVLGSVPVRARGATTVEVPLAAQAGEVTFRVVPGSSEYVPGATVSVALPAMHLSEPGWLWHAIGALCFLLWLTWRWLLAARPWTMAVPATRTRARVQTTAQPLPSETIRGSVVDVHTQQPLRAVQLTLVEPRADGETIVESTLSTVGGDFRFETKYSRQRMLRLRATREHFMTLAIAVTATDLIVELRSTRRTALQSLIDWARRSGRPWDVAPTPTTGHVQQTAVRQHDPQVGAWAAEIERAAFGPASPSEPEVTELLSRRPKDPRKTSSL